MINNILLKTMFRTVKIRILFLLLILIMLVGTSYSNAFASVWNIQTVDPGGALGWTIKGEENSIAIDSSGHPHVSYLYQDTLVGVYYLNYAFWDGDTWQIQTLYKIGETSGKTSLVLDSNDHPHIGFTIHYIGDMPVIAHTRWNGSSWEGFTIDYGCETSISIDVNGIIHISYSYPYSVIIDNIAVPRSDLKYAYGSGQNWQIQTIEYGGRIGEESSLVIDSQTHPHIAYQDFGVVSRQLKYAYWNGSDWEIQVVDDQGPTDASISPSLSLDSADRPCISYHGENYSLNYASHNGATWQIQTVEAWVGHYFLPNSLALDQADRPHISYQDNGLSILKYAVWNGSTWAIEIVDESGSPGLYNSIAVDIGNIPHICYWELDDGDLMHATIHIQDGDEDGLSDSIENVTCSDPFDADSDDDGISDGEEDINHNGVVDLGETNPCNSDSDGDGIQDGTEKGITSGIADPDGTGPASGTDISIFVPDTDPTTTTDPTNPDSDNDGYKDGEEDLNKNGCVDVGESDPNSPDEIVLRADINGDGIIDLEDAIIALQITTGFYPPSLIDNYSTSKVDVNGDGKAGLEEVIYILHELGR